MDVDHSRPMQEEEICEKLEFAVLKYFPRPVEDIEPRCFNPPN